MRNPSGTRKTFTGVRYTLPDFRPTCITMPKPGNRAANRLVIRFVKARLKAATHLLRNRIRMMGASRIARSGMTDAAITMADYLYCRLCSVSTGCTLGRKTSVATPTSELADKLLAVRNCLHRRNQVG